ncbi:MAG: hypothetical protein AAFQ74_09540 [Cyanobacteria bacterium J06623_4]
MEAPSPDPNGAEKNRTDSNKNLTEQIKSQITSLEAEAKQVDNSEVHARVLNLIALIKKSLRSRTLPAKTQRELARLLSLTPKLDNRHIQQLNLLDLAISTLLEAPQVSSAAGPLADGTSDTTRDSSPSQAAEAKNLVFVQETRRQIAQQSSTYPNVLRSILITGEGTPYIRLIAGLSWFFLIFVVLPVITMGTAFYIRELVSVITAANTVDYLVEQKQQLETEIVVQQREIEQLDLRRQELGDQLAIVGDQVGAIAKITPTVTTPLPAPSPTPPNPAATPTPTNPAPANPAPTATGENGETVETLSFITVNPQELVRIEAAIDKVLTRDETAATESAARAPANPESTATPRSGASSSAPSEPISGAQSEAAIAQAVADAEQQAADAARSEAVVKAAGDRATDRRIFKTSMTLILLAVSIGALGSTVSVVVRANTFIRQAQESESDLFLTGFFRPLVGMSFAIFCVALVEAGIFSGIFDIADREEDRTYFYVAIAFVAGFSERLVRDVVIKTEDSIAGPITRTDRLR